MQKINFIFTLYIKTTTNQNNYLWGSFDPINFFRHILSFNVCFQDRKITLAHLSWFPHHRLVPVLKKHKQTNKKNPLSVLPSKWISKIMVCSTLQSEFTPSNFATWLRIPPAARMLEVTQVCNMKMTTWTKSSDRYCPVVCCYQLVLASNSSSPWGLHLLHYSFFYHITVRGI